MRNIPTLAALLTLLLAGAVGAQEKHDFVWVLGAGPNMPELWSGGNLIDFRDGNPRISYFPITYDMDNPVNMSDRNGNLQFYSSGCDVLNKEYEVMDNGDQLSPGPLHNLYCDNFGWGYWLNQAILALPWPGDSAKYVLLHGRRKTYNHDSTTVLYTLIDMSANGGLGRVTEKNLPLSHGRYSWSFTAARHANGRDWWVVVPEEATDNYFFYLLDPTGFKGPFFRQPSPGWIPGQYGNAMCAFSPDGSKFVRTGGIQPAAFRLYDFDRCTGTLSAPVTVPVPDTLVSTPWACFSPNSRYLYFSNRASTIYQYDTEAGDIGATAEVVGWYGGYVSVWGLAATPYAMALGPDKRVYITSGNGVNVLHTIERPDLPGKACDYRPHSVPLPATILFIPPNQPNYRLYDLRGSGCDTLGVQPPMAAFWRSGQDSLAQSPVVHFTDLSYHEPVSWHWDFGDGTTSAEQSPSHPYQPGKYTVCLTACNGEGACDELCRDIAVWAVSSAGELTDAGGQSALVFPNPASASARVVFRQPVGRSCSVELYDMSGRLVLSASVPEGVSEQSLDLSACQSGIYVLLAREEGRLVAREKLAVVK